MSATVQPERSTETEIAVIGAGTMGHALALVFALGGHQVRLTDSYEPMLRRASELMANALATLVEGGEAPSGRDRGWLDRAVRIRSDLAETVAGADLVVEAIVEQPDAQADALCSARKDDGAGRAHGQ